MVRPSLMQRTTTRIIALPRNTLRHTIHAKATAMHQAQVTTWGEAPRYVSVAAPPPPAADELRVKVLASGLHRVVRSRAAGSHYSSGPLPHVPGIDGVGTTPDGEPVYFSSFSVGAMSEEVNVPKRSVCAVPEGLDPIKAAGMINPAMSSWMGLKARTSRLEPGFSVLVLGVTSASGRLAVPLARAMGAGRVMGAARNKAAMDAMEGLDEKIVIAEKPEDTDFGALGEVDVVLDYVYGALTLHLFNAIKTPRPVDYVHIGALSGEMEMNVPGAILRSKDITIRGSGPGAWQMSAVLKEMPALLEALKHVPEQPIKVTKLSEVESQWDKPETERVVFAP